MIKCMVLVGISCVFVSPSFALVLYVLLILGLLEVFFEFIFTQNIKNKVINLEEDFLNKENHKEKFKRFNNS